MGKTKEKSGKSSLTESKANGVKASRVTKPAESIKAGSKKLAAETATKISQLKEKDSKKSKKGKSQPPPPPSDSETSESSESESESEAESNASSDSGSSDDESVEENVPKKAKVNGSAGLTNGAKKAAEASSDESDSSEGDSSESEDEAAPAKKPATNGAAAKAAASKGDSDDETSEGSASSDSDSDEADAPKEAAVAPPKKRKAEAETEPEAKKSKTEGNETSNLFVGNISWNVDEEWLRREFAAHGEVVGCRIMTDRATGRSKGFGYVDFADAASAAAALEAMKGYELDNRTLNVDLSQPRQQKEGFGGNAGGFAKDRASKFGDEVKSSPSDTLFVGNISFSATAEAFQETFGEYGTVTRVSLPTDQETGSLKGFGYVSFTSLSEAQAALEALNGAEIEGRRIRLDFATPRTGGGDRGGRGGGRGFGGGRGGFDRGGRGGGRGFGGGRGGGGRGFGGGRGGGRGGRPNTTERGGFGDFSGSKVTF